LEGILPGSAPVGLVFVKEGYCLKIELAEGFRRKDLSAWIEPRKDRFDRLALISVQANQVAAFDLVDEGFEHGLRESGFRDLIRITASLRKAFSEAPVYSEVLKKTTAVDRRNNGLNLDFTDLLERAGETYHIEFSRWFDPEEIQRERLHSIFKQVLHLLNEEVRECALVAGLLIAKIRKPTHDLDSGPRLFARYLLE